jgi:putative transposase
MSPAPLGRTKGKFGFHGGKVAIERPRVRGLDGAERVLSSWENAVIPAQ